MLVSSMTNSIKLNSNSLVIYSLILYCYINRKPSEIRLILANDSVLSGLSEVFCVGSDLFSKPSISMWL